MIDRITVPTLILSAHDDPFVPPTQFRDPAVSGNTHVTTAIQRHGGHCGFYAEPVNGLDGYWAEHTAVAFARRHCVGS